VIRTRRVTVEAGVKTIAGRCNGFRLRPDYRVDATPALVAPLLVHYGTFPVVVVPVDARGQTLDAIHVTSAEWVPLPSGVVALQARHEFADYLMPFLLDTSNDAASVMDSSSGALAVAVLYDAPTPAVPTDYDYQLPTYGLPYLNVHIEHVAGAAAVAKVFMVQSLASSSSVPIIRTVPVPALATTRIQMGPQAVVGESVPAGDPAAFLIPGPMSPEVQLRLSLPGGASARVTVVVGLGQ
jgi:hypothetical protein